MGERFLKITSFKSTGEKFGISSPVLSALSLPVPVTIFDKAGFYGGNAARIVI